MILGLIYDWCEERLEIQSIADDIISKLVPPHVNIFYCFGGLILTCLIIQSGTGIGLILYYRATVVEAYKSTQFTLTIRSIHRWSSGNMVLVCILHMNRTHLTGGLKKPRELIWITGIILAMITISFGVTGYSLSWDQIGYWACAIVTTIPEALNVLYPSIGKILIMTLRGDDRTSQSTLTRLYSIHTFVLPILITISCIIHFSMLRKQGISGPL